METGERCGELGLKAGVQLVVPARGDAVVFQKIEAPDRGEFDELVREARRRAGAAGLKPVQVKRTIR